MPLWGLHFCYTTSVKQLNKRNLRRGQELFFTSADYKAAFQLWSARIVTLGFFWICIQGQSGRGRKRPGKKAQPRQAHRHGSRAESSKGTFRVFLGIFAFVCSTRLQRRRGLSLLDHLMSLPPGELHKRCLKKTLTDPLPLSEEGSVKELGLSLNLFNPLTILNNPQ